jgi:hypothetical protein
MRSSEIRKEMPCLSSWKQEKIAARQNEYLRVRVRVCVCVYTTRLCVCLCTLRVNDDCFAHEEYLTKREEGRSINVD